MERLHVLLAEERLAKEAASAGLEELQKDSQQKQKQMRDGFESRLRERQKELTACKLRLQVRLQALLHEPVKAQFSFAHLWGNVS